MTRRLLVTGATGKQGSALIAALITNPSNPFEIYALTRNKTSPSALRLASKPAVTLIQGNLSNPHAILAQIPAPLNALFAVPLMTSGAATEESQAKALTAAAVAAGVQHIVFTSTDRGGQRASERNPTSVPHFASKFRVEEYIKATVAEKNKSNNTTATSSPGKLTYTFLRPVAFFENFTNDFFGPVFPALWRLNSSSKLQFIATSDIGRVAAAALLDPSDPSYRNAAISLAGDSLSLDEVTKIFKEETGRDLPETYAWLGKAIRWGVKDLREMFAWFRAEGGGFGVDVPALRERYPGLKDFRTWVREESAWRK